MIRKASGADHCTGNFVQPYRVPGCPCFVDSRKAARGRTTTATRLLRITDELWTPERITTAFSIAVAKPRPAKKAAGASNTGARIPRKLVAVKKKLAAEITADMDRSAQFQSAINAAVRGNMAPDQFEELARQYPNGCAGKYLEGTDRLRAEIDRSYVKAQQPAEPVAPAPQHLPCTLADVHAVFRKWFGSEFDTDTVDAVMAAAAAQRLAGDPLWLLVVSGPGNAKTETVQSLSGAGALITSTIASEGALLSALPPSSPNATGGLLRKIGDHGLLVIKDVTSIISMDHNLRGAVLAALREIHDGRWSRNVGTDGGQTLYWEGRIVVIGACTTAWDQAHSVIATMGDRFVLIRSDSHKGRIKSGLKAMRNTGNEAKMREELAASVAGVVAGVKPDQVYALDDDDLNVLVQAANLVTLARTGVELDYRGNVVDAHDPEMPTRFAKQLCQIMRGAVSIGLDRLTARRLAMRCAKDSMPQLRLAVLRDVDQNPRSRVADVRRRLQKPRATIDRTLQALHTLGLLVCEEQEPRKHVEDGLPFDEQETSGDGGNKNAVWKYRLAADVDLAVLDDKNAAGVSPHS